MTDLALVRQPSRTALMTPAVPLSDVVGIAKRNLLRIARTPQLLFFASIQPVMLVLLFRYVFGGAIKVPGLHYVDYLLPGIFVQTALFGGAATSVGLAEDQKGGVIDRFRSLPMARSAVLAGRTIADLCRNVLVVALVLVVGLLVGFRFHTTRSPTWPESSSFSPSAMRSRGSSPPSDWPSKIPRRRRSPDSCRSFRWSSPARRTCRSRACPAGYRASPMSSRRASRSTPSVR